MTEDLKFVQAARRAAIQWKATTDSLSEAARAPGSYRQFKSLPFCLPVEFAHENLLSDARSVALERFAAAGIPWHDGRNGGPSNHLLSSQVQCANALAPLVDRPDALAVMLGSVLPIAEVLPFGASERGLAHLSPFDACDHVVFEWQGLDNHLNEWSGSPVRGSRATSTDAAIRYRAHDGSIEIALIEWKYTERYPSGALSGSSTSNATRTARYQALFDAPDGPIDTSKITLADLFAEPVYQLARMALLARCIENARELDADAVRVVYVAPRQNDALWASPASPAFSAAAAAHGGRLDTTWSRLLRDPSRFVVLDSATLVSPEAPTPTEFKLRYGHLAGPGDREVDSSDVDFGGEQTQWGRAIPTMYRQLASPTSRQSMPAPPQPGDDTFAATAYWTPLLHLLLYSFAWTRPARGLRWWIDNGKPDDDPHFAFIQRVWGANGQLDWFAAWLCDGPLSAGFDVRSPGGPHPTLSEPMRPDAQWLARCRREADESRIPAPYISGGYDPLHLSYHCSDPLERPGNGWQLDRGESASDHATLIVPGLTGWYRAIGDAAERDWPGRPRAARIDVSCTGVGTLGRFRQSPGTALWTSVSERSHLVGS